MHETPRRRDFVRQVLLGSGIGIASAQSATRADDPPPQDEEEQPAATPKTEAGARMDLIVARFGKLLDEDARRAVQREIEGHVRRAESLRKFELTNADEPAPVFAAYRAPLA